MKFIWAKKELTLMIIPGAHRRTVRFKLPQSMLIIVPSLLLLVLTGFVITIYVMHTTSDQTKLSMQAELDGHDRQFTEQLTQKNSELEKLQTDLITLSRQANDFKDTLEEIKQLDHVIELMAEPEGASGTSKKAAGSPSPTAPKRLDIGGSDTPVTSDEVFALVGETKDGLSSLVSDINGLLEHLKASEAKIKEAEYIRSITPTLWPIANHRISSGFGIRLDPFTLKPSMHTGLDLDGDMNDPVYVAAAGKVIEAGFDNDHGNHIIVEHSKGLETEYMHLNKMLVKRGESVSKGQQIGLVGSTGRSTGSHLHYEVHKNGVPISPMPYLITDRKDDERK
ncbi:M23 family metallopeptidase [Paenibacillus ferrarius]|uniref:M23 family metallopeptidase n=1 Tax=Paenibacillus ferrarius TaxID=1469647 RepID=UPI003D2C9E14